jgi:hypothetical protein
MIATAPICLALITIRSISSPDELKRWNDLMRRYHYLASERMVGEQLRYVAEYCGQWVALLGWSAASLKLQDRDTWIGWNPAQARQRLHLVAQNARFLVLPGYEQPNLASRCLGLNIKCLSRDWAERYGHPIILAETFVESARNNGTCYRASGWTEIGATKGFRRTNAAYREHGIVKRILVKEVQRHGRQLLGGRAGLEWDRSLDHLELAAQPVEGDVDATDGPGRPSLFSIIKEHIIDPRSPRGRSYRLECLMGILLTGLLAGHTTCAGVAEWATDLKPHERKRLRCPYRKDAGYTVPTANTLRYLLQDLNPRELEQAVRLWVAACGINSDHTHIAIDGKIICGSGRYLETARAHLSAWSVDHGAVVHQQGVPEKTNEISAARDLLADLDLRGTLISGDAAHTNSETAMIIAEKKGSTFLPSRVTSLDFWLPPRARLINHRT